MCGIGGVWRLGNEPIDINQISALIVNLEHRGGDSTGVAVRTGGQIHVFKQAEIGWKFAAGDGFRDFLKGKLADADVVMIHTRSWTKGDPRDNRNNHPMFSGETAIVHNGVIQNDDDLFRDLRLKRTAETDSDILRAILDKEGLTKKAIKLLRQVRGSVAASAIHPDFPNKLMIMRSGSQLCFGKSGDHFMWASEKQAIHKAMRVWERRWGMYFQANRVDLKFNPVDTDTLWIFDADEMRADTEPFHTEFDVCKTYNRPNYRVHDTYEEKQKKLDNTPPPPAKEASPPSKASEETNEVASEADSKTSLLLLPASVAPLTKPQQESSRQQKESIELDDVAAVLCAKCATPNDITQEHKNIGLVLSDLECGVCGAALSLALGEVVKAN